MPDATFRKVVRGGGISVELGSVGGGTMEWKELLTHSTGIY